MSIAGGCIVIVVTIVHIPREMYSFIPVAGGWYVMVARPRDEAPVPVAAWVSDTDHPGPFKEQHRRIVGQTFVATPSAAASTAVVRHGIPGPMHIEFPTFFSERLMMVDQC